MFACRQLVRKSIQASTKTPMMQVLKMHPRSVASGQSLLTTPVVKTFSSFEMIERSTAKLNKALESEIKYENENYTQLEDIETFLNESGFVFKETDDGL